ncbi:MAG: HAD family phosphatase [Eubacteriales bacterium]|nr:HAD family phosphatase [Eubacteriales bacterium]
MSGLILPGGRLVRACVFDIDGTLIDSMPIWDDLGARYLRSVGAEPEKGLGAKLFPMTIAESVAYMKKAYGLSQSEDEIRRGLSDITENFYRNEVQLKEGAAEFLEALDEVGIPMNLATIGESSLETAALERLGVAGYFQDLVTCEELGTTKRDPDIYIECARRLGADPAETAVFEDIYQAVHAAREGGFISCAVRDQASREDFANIKDEADFFFDDFTEAKRVWFA